MRATARPFFDPRGDGVSGDTEGAREPTQTAAFLVGTKNLLTSLLRVGIARWAIAALTTTGATQVALLTIWCEAIADDVIALAMKAM